MTSWSEVQAPWWDDRPVFIIGGGPSLRGHDLSQLRERGWVLGINKASEFWPVDATFSLDRRFITESAFRSEGERYLAVPELPEDPGVPGARYLRRVEDPGISQDPGRIHNGRHSGHGAIQLALLKRARTIYLLGYDLIPPEKGHSRHWYDDGENAHGPGSLLVYYGRWATGLNVIAAELPPGVQVSNCNPRSAVRCFAFSTYEEVLG